MSGCASVCDWVCHCICLHSSWLAGSVSLYRVQSKHYVSCLLLIIKQEHNLNYYHNWKKEHVAAAMKLRRIKVSNVNNNLEHACTPVALEYDPAGHWAQTEGSGFATGMYREDQRRYMVLFIIELRLPYIICVRIRNVDFVCCLSCITRRNNWVKLPNTIQFFKDIARRAVIWSSC